MKDKEYHFANFATFVSITLIFPPQKWMNLIFSSFWMMTMRSFRLKTNIPGTFPLFVYILVNILTIFYLLKLKIRASPSPPSQQQTKKIKSYHKSWIFQDFLSFQAMKYMGLSLSLRIKIRPLHKTMDECFQKLVSMSPSWICLHRNNGAWRTWQGLE